MKWMITEDKLGADQIEVIDEIGKINDRPIWIKGHAGSGKSVLLLHSLADYIIKTPKARICIVVFTRALVDLLKTGLQQIPKLAGKSIPVLTIYELKAQITNKSAKYDAIFCDEIQDLPLEFIESIKSFCTHLILAGDAEQSIYNSVPVFNVRPATSREMQNSITPIEKKLGVIYRLTESVLKMLKRVFPSMLNDMPNLARTDTEIQLYKADSYDAEVKFCWDEIKQTNRLRTLEVSAILLSRHENIIEFTNTVLKIEGKATWQRIDANGMPNYQLLNAHLKNSDIPLMYIGNNYGSLATADKDNLIIIMTYHSAKGLDFDYVYLPMANNNMYIHSNIDSLLLVALSRSKAGLFVSYTGDIYPNLQKFVTGIPVKQIPEGDIDSEEILF